MSIFSSYKKIFLLGFILVILVAIPFSVYIAQKRQSISSKAALSTTLSFDPASTTINVGDTLIMGIILDPNTGSTPNQVSFMKLSINFDSSKFTTSSDSLGPNPEISTLTTVEGPQYGTGKASISISVGADPINIISGRNKIAILKLKAIAAGTSSITFDSDPYTQILSIAPATDRANENVLYAVNPATVIVSSTTIPTTTPTSTPITPTPTSTPILTPTPTLTPTQTPTGISGANPPTCTNLIADRSTTGTVPYSLTFTATGNDSNGTVNKVSFNFGDGQVQVATAGGGIGTSSVNTQMSHTYNSVGSYAAYAILTDNANNLSAQQANCTKTITVSSAQAIPVPIPTQTIIQPLPTQVVLPPTGPGEKIFGVGVVGAIFTIVGGALLLLL